MEFNKLMSSLESGNISPYQVYNLDLDYPQVFGVEHYVKNKNDNINTNQKLHKLFLDIEVISDNQFDFDKIDEGKHPISCITIFSNLEKIFHVFVLLTKGSVDSWNSRNDHVDYFKQQIVSGGYLDGDFDIIVKTYTSDMPLIKDCWSKIHELDPIIITGWNSDGFDLPYIFYRLKYLYNGDLKSVSKVLSKFGDVTISNWGGSRGQVRLVEYVNMDLAYLFRPRSDNGLNQGKTLASYSLDFVSETILERKKLDFKNQNLTLDQFYVLDTPNYVLYNIIDVTLCVLLDRRLKMIDSYNLYRRLMKTTASESLRGSTALFDTLVLYNLTEKKEAVRFGLTDETIITIDKSELDKLPKPLAAKNIKWSINSIDQRTYLKITRKFEGAYVKSSPGKVFDSGDGLIIDLDASLPPWEKIYIRNSNGIFWGCIGDYYWQEGDETLTWDKNNNTCWRKVKGKTEHPWNKELIKFTTETGKEVYVTSNHSIFAIQKDIRTDTPYLTNANDLKIGDSVVGYINFEPGVDRKLIYPELVGFWLSDGWVNSSGSLFYIAKQDPELLEIFAPSITKIRIKRQESLMYKEEWVGQIDDPLLKAELNKFYIHTTRKNFFEILNYDRETRRKIWDGMFFADGTQHGLNQSHVITPTERLCKYRKEELIECFLSAHTITWRPKLRQNGIDNIPTKSVDKSNRYGPGLVIPEVYASKSGYTKNLAILHLSANHRHPYEKMVNYFPYIKNAYSNQVGLEKIVKIEKQEYNGLVYDISVDETERFFAGTGIGVHNTSLYPNMIRQNNISFDTYFGRIIDPTTTEKVIAILDVFLKNKQDVQIKTIYSSFLDLSSKYIESDKITTQNKSEATQQYYYVLSYLFNKILESKATSLKEIFQPKDHYFYILLKKYLIPFINLIDEVNPLNNNVELNTFCYDYLLSGEITHKSIYVIENINQPSIRITQLLSETLDEYLKKNQLILTLTGCLFYQHEKKTSFFASWLESMYKMRKEYIKERDKYEEGSEQYDFYDSRQKSTKVASNSAYGLFGQATYRYSNNWLAKTITGQGRLSLKIAQQIAEDYLKEV